jgi:DNA ligase-associated metallophosphoesterase
MENPRDLPTELPPREVIVTVGGARLVLRGDRTLFCPEHGWLVIADLHNGKAESLRRDGIALPDAVMSDDLARLQLAVAETRATRLLVLGDLVHNAAGLTAGLVRRVTEWRARIACDIALIPGNHDRRVNEMPAPWRITQLDEALRAGPFRISHAPLPAAVLQPASGGGRFHWHGHLHPVRTVRGVVDRVRVPDFAIDDRLGIPPAFSTLTGGSESPRDRATRQWVVVDGRVVDLTPPALDAGQSRVPPVRRTTRVPRFVLSRVGVGNGLEIPNLRRQLLAMQIGMSKGAGSATDT